MDRLRAECPWDKKQTLETLRPLTIEETYELAEAIIKNDPQELKGEIGDLMLHMVFYSKIASELGYFDIEGVLNGICEKLIRRHPHIYGDTKNINNEEDVKKQWEKLKLQEGRKSVLEGVPRGLPAMVKATRIQDKAAKIGFDWEKRADVWEKVKEEEAEFHEVLDKDAVRAEEEFGDYLFALINYARFCDIDPETALERTNQKFIKRFNYIEEHATKPLDEMTLDEMEVLWVEAKTK